MNASGEGCLVSSSMGVLGLGLGLGAGLLLKLKGLWEGVPEDLTS